MGLTYLVSLPMQWGARRGVRALDMDTSRDMLFLYGTFNIAMETRNFIEVCFRGP